MTRSNVPHGPVAVGHRKRPNRHQLRLALSLVISMFGRAALLALVFAVATGDERWGLLGVGYVLFDELDRF